MATEWFYRNGSKQVGPVSAKQIRALAEEGTIAPDTPLRKASDEKWIRANRLKGLFDGVEQSSEPQPTTSPISETASSVSAAVGSAASAVGGAVSGFLARRKEKKAESVEAHGGETPGWFDNLTRDNQPPTVVAKVVEKLQGILMEGEDLVYVAVQNKPVVNVMPDCVALTTKRFIFYRTKVLGRVDFEDYVWRELQDARLSEDVVGSTFSVSTAAGEKLSMSYLPKQQARAIYRIAQEQEERALDERRRRHLEESRAAAGGVVLGVQAPPSQQPGTEADDPVQKLQQLKQMADAGLISEAEYEAKKADILSRM